MWKVEVDMCVYWYEPFDIFDGFNGIEQRFEENPFL